MNFEIVCAIVFAVLGISHIVRPRVWIDFFDRLRGAGHAGVFMLAMLHLIPAMLIVSLHNRWTGLGMVLTLIGWGWMIKASLYLIFPAVGMWGLSQVRPERARHFVIAGVVLLVVSGLLVAGK